MDTDIAQPDPSALLTRLRETLREALPFCSGTLELPSKLLELYYGEKNHHYINFSESQSHEGQRDLDELEKACEAAPFGRNQETVLDETYRKAGKMETDAFLMRFDAARAGLIDVVQNGLLTGPREKKGIREELYKLNVYGVGEFFKPHVDTPHSPQMFGSLVVVFPSPHEGGQLVLRQEGREWTFDAAQLLSGRNDRIAYVAFFSDVEHEVLPVLSGHRVTVTYNLYYADDSSTRPSPPQGLAILRPVHANTVPVKGQLDAFLRSLTDLPPKAALGFGLRHVYAMPITWDGSGEDPLDTVRKNLKGSDAALYRACEELGLSAKLHVLAKNLRRKRVMLDHTEVFSQYYVNDDDDYDDSLLVHHWYRDTEFPFSDENGDVDAASASSGHSSGDEEYRHGCYRKRVERPVPVYWVTRKDKWNRTSQPYVMFCGNGAAVGFIYFSVCLIIKIGARGADTAESTGDDGEGDDDEDNEDGDGVDVDASTEEKSVGEAGSESSEGGDSV